MSGKGRERTKKAFGSTEEGLPDTPQKMSNVRLSRLENADEQGGCSFCFPHGIETTNSTIGKKRRSWKNNRKTKYRPKKAD